MAGRPTVGGVLTGALPSCEAYTPLSSRNGLRSKASPRSAASRLRCSSRFAAWYSGYIHSGRENGMKPTKMRNAHSTVGTPQNRAHTSQNGKPSRPRRNMFGSITVPSAAMQPKHAVSPAAGSDRAVKFFPRHRILLKNRSNHPI